MTTQTTYSDIIDRKIRGELTPQEQNEFDQMLLQDPFFRLEWEKMQKVIRAIQAEALEREKEQLRRLLSGKEQGKEIPFKPKRNNPFIIFISGVAATLISVFLLFNLNGNPALSSQYALCTEPLNELVQDTRRGGSEDELNFSIARDHYKNGDWKSAGDALMKISDRFADYQLVLLLMADCELRSGHPQQALDQIARGSLHTQSGLKEYALWISSFAYYQLGDRSKAIDAMKEVAALEGKYATQARNFLHSAGVEGY